MLRRRRPYPTPREKKAPHISEATRARSVAGSRPLVAFPLICHTATMRRTLLVLAAVLAIFVSGCGSKINPDGAAKSVVDVVSKQTKFKPKDVSCPSGVDAEVGVEFDCTFTGPEGVEYTAHMKVTKVEGENVEFYVESKPS
jgi:Domain of unknown function (DUF4333)